MAIKQIDINADPFQTVYKLDTTSIDLSEKDLESLDPGVSTLIKDFFMKTSEDTYPVYFNGLNAMDIAYYLNHSDNPNVIMVYEPRMDDREVEVVEIEVEADQMQIGDPNFYQGTDKMGNFSHVFYEKNPNLEEEDTLEDSFNNNTEYYTFRTIRPIMPGEELTIDYYQNARSLKEILEIRRQFKLPFPSYALKPKKMNA
jgi:hypothetical protein